MSSNYINLWECLTHVASCDTTYPEKKKQHDELLKGLSESACFHQQEIGLEAKDYGWEITVFSAGEQDKITIRIPKHGGRPSITIHEINIP